MKKTIFLFFAAILCAMSVQGAASKQFNDQQFLYCIVENTNWKSWGIKYNWYWDSGNWYATENGNKISENHWYAKVPNAYIGGVQFIRCSKDFASEWDWSVTKNSNTRTDNKINCAKITGSNWGNATVSWTTYAPPMSSVTLSNNGTTVNSGSGTQADPYIIEIGTKIKVKGSGAKAVEDPDAKVHYTFKYGDASQDSETATWEIDANSPSTTYAIELEGYTKVNTTSSEKKAATKLYYQTVADATLPTYQVTVTANDPAMGTVTGAGEYSEGATAELTATPNDGYQFKNWTVAGAEVSTANSYTFTVNADITVTANFEETPKATIYFVNNSGWSKIQAYAWEGTKGANPGWPGADITANKLGEQIGGFDVYSYTVEQGSYGKVIFNNGSAQTKDYVWTDGNYYWNNEPVGFAGGSKADAESKFSVPVEYDYVYFINTNSWAAVNIYTWNSEIATWPGVAMNKEAEQIAGFDVYSHKEVKGTTFGGMKFNEGKDKKETGNLTWQAGKYYAPSKDKWYDTKEAAEEALATPVIDVYTIMGAGELGLSWDLATTGNDMTKQADGTYTLVKEGLDLATTGNYEYKVVKNHSWDWSIPTGTDNQTLKVDKDGTYTVTFTLSSDKKKLTADALCTAEKEVILDCFVAGTINLVGGTADFTDKLAMTYDEESKTYSKTFTALAAGNYQMKVVYGSDWLGYDKLTKPVPANVTEGDDKKIKFSLAEASDVTVTYNVENGIGLVGTFAAPETKYYIAGTQNLTGFDWKENGLEMTKEGDVYKHTFSEVNAGIYEFKITDGTWTKTWGFSNLAKNYVGVSQGKDGEGNDNGNIKIVTEEAKNITVIFDLANNNITLEGWEEEVPTVITYVLMGVNGDWTTGIELTQNPDNANEYMLLNQTITRATDAIKVVTLTNGTATAWCGDVDEYSDAIYENNWDKDGNIELEDGIYNFYFKVSDKKIYIDQTTLLRTGTNKYGTIYIPYTPESVSGATFYQVAGKGTEDGQEGVYLESVDVVEAGKPYIYERTGNQVVKIVFSGEKATNGGAVNGLIGTDTKSTHVPVNNYILINNTFCKTDGSSKVRGYRAYLDLNAVTGDKPQPMPGRRYIGMSVQGENAATGLDNITNGENTTIKFIENGQLIIIRNGEKFNAQGQKF